MTSCKQALQANEYRCGSININIYILMVAMCWLQVCYICRNHQGQYFYLLTNQLSFLGLAEKSLVLHAPIVPLLRKQNPFSTVLAINPL